MSSLQSIQVKEETAFLIENKMGQGVSSGQDKKKKKGSNQKPKYEPPVQSKFGRKKRKGGPATAEKITQHISKYSL